MGRWTQYDEDDYRLPEGMKRIGYDSDTGQYFFRDKDGSVWMGSKGAEFGEMQQVDEGPIVITTDGEDVESGQQYEARGDGYVPLATDMNGTVRQSSRPTSAYRTIFPFFLLIAVTLLLVYRLVGSPHSSSPPPCPKNSTDYFIKSGDTCWQISKTYGCKLEEMISMNSGLKCDALKVGQRICVPYSDT